MKTLDDAISESFKAFLTYINEHHWKGR